MEIDLSNMQTLTTGIIIVTIIIIVISFISALPLILKATKTLSSLKKGQEDASRLHSQGRDATAKVTSINSTGAMINFQPETIVGLEVNDGSRTYPVQITTVIPQVKLPQVQPGMQVAVKVDPQDPNKVVLNLA